ncbi:MAG TPA: galactose oxidase [Candidatus Latescibacteria bacterium]|nr:galactose oxidase [Gemmatimonadota bacterium]HCR18625.1 galactose oxidase [Candidatus Latescibacterota bacterium]|tara:strand:+ start:265 stop:1209 length:945 start_codon:yes stop_codon:yes gene_type:complete
MHEQVKGPDWVLVNEKADWEARDSQGMMVFEDHMWIYGGWFTPQTPNPRDVWKSNDGINWTCTTEEALWVHGDFPATMPLNGKMWLMGGRKLPGKENSNKVWSSPDGTEWTLETDDPGWCPRVSPSFVVFQDRMWLMAGTENFYQDDETTMKNDVWSTADGVNWRMETDNADWSKRTHAQACVFKDKMWIMGGGAWQPETIPLNDVWCSGDGVSWEQVTAAAPWTKRMWFQLEVYRDRMWLLGGWNRDDGDFGDVWFTEDGENWTEMTHDVIWKNRHAPSSYVFDDRIWLCGGHARPLTSEVWSLEIPEAFFEG